MSKKVPSTGYVVNVSAIFHPGDSTTLDRQGRRHQRQDDNAFDSSHDDPDDNHRQDEHLLRAQPIDDVDGIQQKRGGWMMRRTYANKRRVRRGNPATGNRYVRMFEALRTDDGWSLFH